VRSGTTLTALVTMALATATPCSFAALSGSAVSGGITVRSTETLKGGQVTNGGVSGTGRFTISGVITDTGNVTDYRTVKGSTARIRRVTVGAKGTITFLIVCRPAAVACTWTITSGTKAYKGFQGKGTQVVDKYYATPAIFVLKGTVSR
jgi:hypothetical protein